MIRSIRLGLAFCLSMASLALLPPASTSAVAAEASARRMELPAPDKTGGVPLMQALAQRFVQPKAVSTARRFRRATIEQSALGCLGRQPRRRTPHRAFSHEQAGSAGFFAALDNGVWRYEPGHSLTLVLEGDWRAKLGGGSLVLLYAAPTASRWSGMHVGSIYQNVGLFCASAGLGDCARFEFHGAGRHAAAARGLGRAYRPERGFPQKIVRSGSPFRPRA